MHCSEFFFCVYQVYSTSYIHEYSIHIIPSYLGIEYQRRVTWLRYYYWMVFSVEFYQLLGPVQVLCNYWRRCYCQVDLPRNAFLLFVRLWYWLYHCGVSFGWYISFLVFVSLIWLTLPFATRVMAPEKTVAFS
jgi:hypothetical protein